MKEYVETLRRNIENSIEAHQLMLANDAVQEVFAQAVKLVVNAYRKGGRLYIAGNGGSAADAQHLAAEFVSKLARPRAPLPAEALTVDTSIITAIGNDYGYDQIFSRQIRGKMTPRDVFLGITTSGESLNILKALETCRDMEIPSVVFCGREGGAAKPLADYCVVAPGAATSRIQENHIVLYHTLCECVESELFPEETV